MIHVNFAPMTLEYGPITAEGARTATRLPTCLKGTKRSGPRLPPKHGRKFPANRAEGPSHRSGETRPEGSLHLPVHVPWVAARRSQHQLERGKWLPAARAMRLSASSATRCCTALPASAPTHHIICMGPRWRPAAACDSLHAAATVCIIFLAGLVAAGRWALRTQAHTAPGRVRRGAWGSGVGST